MEFVIIDNCPVPDKRGFPRVIRQIKERSGATLVSCDRSKAAEPILRKCGKQSQAQLYDGWIRRLPGYNPANPPGFSTHERRNDGVAFPVPRGALLPAEFVGQDWSDAPSVVEAAGELGYTASITYPNNPREGHHVNFRKKPRFRLPALKRGAQGHRVRRLIKALGYIEDPHAPHDPYLKNPKKMSAEFGPTVEAAVKRFQKDHHQKADGVVGPATRRQIGVAVRRRKQRLKERNR